MTPEGRVKEKVKVLLREYKELDGLYWHCPVQNGMGAPSLDFVGCHDSRYFAIETKAPGKALTERQLRTKSEMEAAGGKVFIIDGDLTELRAWLSWAKV